MRVCKLFLVHFSQIKKFSSTPDYRALTGNYLKQENAMRLSI